MNYIKIKYITIGNDGPDIAGTNYWASPQATAGKPYFSINAGSIRVLLPDNMTGALKDMRTAKYVILSRGPWPEMGRDEAMEILFEDHSEWMKPWK